MGLLFRAQPNLTHRMLDPSQLTAVGIIINNGSVWKRYGKCIKLEMWANAQRDGRPAEYRWRPLFNAAKFG